MKHHNQLRSGSLLTYVQMTLNIIVSIAYTPFMLRILGKSEYGLYSTVASTIAIFPADRRRFSWHFHQWT